MPFKFNSKFVQPAPFVEISKEFQTTEDGRIVGTLFNLNIKGKIAADKGSPNSNGVLWTASGYAPDETIAADSRLASIFRKQEGLRGLFSSQNDGKALEFTPWDGSPSIWCNPRIKRPIAFAEGQWFNTCDYSIQMECDILYGSGTTPEDTVPPTGYYIQKASEEWNIEAGDERARTYRLTRNVSAVGKRFYNASGVLQKHAWERAKDYVLDQVGLGINMDRVVATGVLNAGDLRAYNYMRAQRVDELGGTFQVTETWLCYDPGSASGVPAMEEFTCNIRTADNGISQVTCEGTITGFEERDNETFALQTTRYANAAEKWAEISPTLLTRMQTISGLTLNPNPLQLTEGHNQHNGVITYSHEYDDRVSATISGAISELITIQDHNAADVFAAVPVLGRALGPVLQDIDTVTPRKRVIQLEIVMPAARQGFSASQPDTDALVLALLPVGYSVIFMDNDDETWVARNGRYSRSTSFTWE